MFRKVILLILLLAGICGDLNAQPKWFETIPEGYINDYFVGSAVSPASKSAAVQSAIEDAIRAIVRTGIIKVSSSEQYRNEQNNNETVRKIAQELIIEGNSMTIKDLRLIESDTKEVKDGFEAFVLVAISKKHPKTPPSAFSPVWRSMLLPGWGQLYKQEKVKGISFLTLSLAGITAGVVFKQLQFDAENKALSSKTQLRRDYFNTKAKDFNTYCITSFTAGGVMYLWSIVDAIMVKQENLYVELNIQREQYQVIFGLNF